MEKTRRFVLEFVALGTAALSAGCGSVIGDNCHLVHNIGMHGGHQIKARYKYENLSQPAKTAFDGALENDGRDFYVENTDENNPPEFEYGDVLNYYEIEKNDEVYVLATSTDQGC